MSGMFVSGATLLGVHGFNEQPGVMAYLASEQAWVDAKAELHAWSAYLTQDNMRRGIDNALAQTPVGPPWTFARRN